MDQDLPIRADLRDRFERELPYSAKYALVKFWQNLQEVAQDGNGKARILLTPLKGEFEKLKKSSIPNATMYGTFTQSL
jgi:hypothetical protein